MTNIAIIALSDAADKTGSADQESVDFCLLQNLSVFFTSNATAVQNHNLFGSDPLIDSIAV